MMKETRLENSDTKSALWQIAFFGAVFALIALLLLGCSQEAESQADDSEEGYALIGQIMGIKAEEKILTVAHEEIPGYMDAMTMEFRVAPGDIENAKVGEKIRARLVLDEDGGFRLIKIWPRDKKGEAYVEKANKKLKEQIQDMSSGHYLGEEDAAPAFVLYDQNGEIFASDRLKGKAFMMNFIFTRCQDAKMCPLSTTNMANMQRMAKEQGVENLSFVSFTLDPEFDTPGILKEYADRYSIDGSNFHFLTGPKEGLDLLIRAQGVTRNPTEDDILHTLATSLVAPDGTIVMQSRKSAWSVQEFLEKAAEL